MNFRYATDDFILGPFMLPPSPLIWGKYHSQPAENWFVHDGMRPYFINTEEHILSPINQSI
jgi:hypothetical protein